MLKDDRMMSMLTFLMIMVAIGTMIQRADVLGTYFGGGGTALELRRDEAIVRANTLGGIDVLSNDLGLRDGDAKRLIIVGQPACGRVFVRDGQARYLPAERCVGSQSFKYAISGRSQDQIGEVAIVVRLGEPTQSEVAADAQRDIPTAVPAAPRAIQQSVVETPALLDRKLAAAADSDGAVVQAPAAPRPQAPAITGLPDTASGAGSTGGANGGGFSSAGGALGSSGQAPSMAAPAAPLGEASEISTVPAIPAPNPEAPSQPELANRH